ncbi:hypothetical protein HKX48_006652 [Thoreauomyces humboldtii]|nr:hypothetical protein HKX48_006652 [Thoreauomyces humboldtii]
MAATTNALPQKEAQLFYDACLYTTAQMRNGVLPACLKDGTITRVLSIVFPPGLTDEGKVTLASFDEWAQEMLDLVWVGILEKPKKDAPPVRDSISRHLPSRTVVEASPLLALPPASRASLLRTFLLLVLTTTKRYDARTRVLFRHLATSFQLPFPADYEESVDAILKHPEEAIKESNAAAKREESGRTMRNLKIGAAATFGALAIGITGGLAAPFVGAGLATVLGAVGLGGTAAGMLAGGLASSGLVVGSLFGAYGGHKSMKAISNRTKEVSDFDFKALKLEQRLHVTLGVTGWLNKETDVVAPWTIINGTGDVQALQFEVKALLKLGNPLTTLIKSQAVGYLKAEIIKQTVLASLFTALWPLGLLKAAVLVDNPWSNAMELSKKTGVVLADVLIEKVQGERPVTLIGYGIGARVIYYCLEELSRRHAHGTIEHAYMFGLPASGDKDVWKSIRRVVAGRIVNGYSSKDWLLAYLYRTTNVKLSVAGLEPIGLDGVEDLDVSDVVEGHLKYRGAIGKCLQMAGAEDLDDEELREQIKVLRAIERQESSDDAPLEDIVQKGLEANVGGSPTLPKRPDVVGQEDTPPALPVRGG